MVFYLGCKSKIRICGIKGLGPEFTGFDQDSQDSNIGGLVMRLRLVGLGDCRINLDPFHL